jgi:formylglycine-generating enzyme required for sulfatase activity
VSWYEASAFCAWLREQVDSSPERRIWRSGEIESRRLNGFTACLPSEAEWEKAARGEHPSRWPWGDTWEENRANTAEAGLGTTSVPGCFPAGISPCGALDMAGNVWEWTRSKWGRGAIRVDYAYPYDPSDGREEPGGPDLRVVRGGSWFNERRRARCAERGRHIPDYSHNDLGFRVALVPLARDNGR